MRYQQVLLWCHPSLIMFQSICEEEYLIKKTEIQRNRVWIRKMATSEPMNYASKLEHWFSHHIQHNLWAILLRTETDSGGYWVRITLGSSVLTSSCTKPSRAESTQCTPPVKWRGFGSAFWVQGINAFGICYCWEPTGILRYIPSLSPWKSLQQGNGIHFLTGVLMQN